MLLEGHVKGFSVHHSRDKAKLSEEASLSVKNNEVFERVDVSGQCCQRY